MRRHLRNLTAAITAVAAGAAMTAPATAAPKDVMRLVLPVLAPMLPGQQGWVSALWTADDDVCDVRVTAAGTDLEFSYPTNTGEYSSLYKDGSLTDGQIDFTALNVTVDGSLTSSVPVTLTVSYVVQAPGQAKKEDGKCVGSRATETATATLPVVPTTGAAVVQKTTALSVSRATPVWARIVFQGRKPNLGNFRVTVTAPSGLAVGYPDEGAFAGLNNASTLSVGRDDYVAVRLDASGAGAGSYKVPVRATYTGGSFDGEITVTVS